MGFRYKVVKQKHLVTKIHLCISILIVIPVAFLYGFKPWIFLDIVHETVDEHNFLKAIMGVY